MLTGTKETVVQRNGALADWRKGGYREIESQFYHYDYTFSDY